MSELKLPEGDPFRLRTLENFRHQHGETALRLACHAALPVVLNAELLHLLRLNFFFTPPETLTYSAESNLLLSPLCREVDESQGLYEIEPGLRNLLLNAFYETYGLARMREVASWLFQYSDRRRPWGNRVVLERAQQLTALNFLDPNRAKEWLAAAEAESTHSAGVGKEWFVAVREKVPWVEGFIERERRMAEQIQANLLPDSVPNIPGWEFAANLIASRTTGGNFFDFIPLTNGKLGIVIADVADKGMGAALFMALTSTLIRTYALQYPTLPAFAISSVNDRILSDTRASMFVTAFFGILEPHTGRLRYVNAGHPPPIMVSSTKGKQVDQLRVTGMALGIVEKTSWQQKVVKFSPGDMLLLYTDGVAEAQNLDGQFFGEKRLPTLLMSLKFQSANAIAQGIVSAVNEFTSNAPVADDMTLVVVKRVE